jgi:hypothetical protein
MEPKSKQRIFVGFDDGAKSVIYYKPETRKILKSRNYIFLTLTEPTPRSTEGFAIHAPDVRREGEPGQSATGSGTQPQSDDPDVQERQKRKLTDTDNNNDTQRNLRKRPRVDYRRLHDPDEQGEVHEALPTSVDITCNAYQDSPLAGDDPRH